MTNDNEIIAYEMEVKSSLSHEWTKHLWHAEDCPENPADAWRDDHQVRNVRPLKYADEEINDEWD